MLTLSITPLIAPPSQADALPLVDPREFGDGVEHICCRVDSDEIIIDGVTRSSQRPILCVFDSGLTGCVLSQSLVQELGLQRVVTREAGRTKRTNGQRHDGLPPAVSSLQLTLRTERGRRIKLGSSARKSKLFYAQAVPLNWFVDTANGPHVVALGQCVLGRGVLTVDGGQRRATWSTA